MSRCRWSRCWPSWSSPASASTPARLAELSQRYGERLEELETEIEELAGHPLNIASPKQLAQVLFHELRLPVIKKTKTGPSTDADVLETLAEQHPLPAKIIAHRQFAKLKNTYVDALPALIHPTTGRVHASFNQVVAATGRLSSSDPEPAKHSRSARRRAAKFARRSSPAEPGWKLLAADYSQIELRILAHYSQDAALCEAFARDDDIHALVASQVFGVDEQEVTPEMRRKAKAVNFGIIYGQSSFGLAKSLGISQDEAAAFIDGVFRPLQRGRRVFRQNAGRVQPAGLCHDAARPPAGDPRRAPRRRRGSGTSLPTSRRNPRRPPRAKMCLTPFADR